MESISENVNCYVVLRRPSDNPFSSFEVVKVFTSLVTATDTLKEWKSFDVKTNKNFEYRLEFHDLFIELSLSL